MAIDLHLDAAAPRDANHTTLDLALARLCGDRRDPQVGALDTLDLLAALAPCLLGLGLPNFTAANQECAGEFLLALLTQLDFQPGFLVQTLEEGMCQICGGQWQQVT